MRLSCLVGGLLTAILGTGAAPAAAPREPDGYANINRELRIGADVLRAALAEGLPGSRRVLDVEAGYLAGQGVLVLVDLASPWLRISGGDGPAITSLEQIPDLVQDILNELNLGLSRHQVEDLAELREIRDAERLVRAEQRTLRGQIREKRRALQRTSDAGAAEALRRDLDALQAELAAAEEEERGLAEDAATVRNTLDAPARTAGEPSDRTGDLDHAVSHAVCSYGATFRSLDAGERLNLLVRQARVSRYYVFEMGNVRACQKGDVSAETLLAGAYVYQG